MNSQEIKSKITKGVWETHEEEYPEEIHVQENGNFRYLGTMSADNGDVESDWANAAAICLSVNNTFGMNIDPAKVPEMFLLLKAIKTGLENEQEKTPMTKLVIIQIDALLTSAKLD